MIWASSTPPNDPSVAEALGPAWNGKFLINAEFNVLDSGQPDQNHMNEVREQYAPDVHSSSFAQMGYLAGRVATDALLGIEGDITKESVNEAFRSITNFTSDIWCKPWYFDSTHRPERLEQHRPHGGPAGRRRWSRSRTASRSPSCPATRSPRSAPRRRSSA